MPTQRVTKQATHLSETERTICLRVKEARQRLRLDQSEVARRLGLKPHFISMIEKCRAPLRFDIALRFCRELLVNEQWLATGSYASLEREVKRRGIATSANVVDLHPLFFRITCDLWSEDVSRTIPARTLYSTAFSQTLEPFYDRLAAQNIYRPRLRPNEHDTIDIFLTLIHATLEAAIHLLGNEARRTDVAPLKLQREYLRSVFESSMAAFGKLAPSANHDNYKASAASVK